MSAQTVDRAFQRISAVAPGFVLISVVKFQREPFQILFIFGQAFPEQIQKLCAEILKCFAAQMFLRMTQKLNSMGDANALRVAVLFAKSAVGFPKVDECVKISLHMAVDVITDDAA